MRKIIALLFLLGILFISSGQTYEQQSIVPDLEKWLPGKPLESVLAMIEIPYWGIKVSIKERGYHYFIEFIIRKSAHFFIFGFIALSIYSLLPKFKYRLLTAAFFTLLIATLDEYHQSLTGGRTPSHQDVLLDMAGALTTLIILQMIIRVRKQRKKSAKGL